jgi:hypothetical protein
VVKGLGVGETTVCEYECDAGVGEHSAKLVCVVSKMLTLPSIRCSEKQVNQALTTPSFSLFQNGEYWQGDVHGCHINKCSVHPPLPHGFLKCNELCSAEEHMLQPLNIREGAMCSVECDEGFELVGEEQWRCDLSSGRWKADSYCR